MLQDIRSENSRNARDMDGASEILLPDQATPADAIAACAQICADRDYPFMGLQYTNQCFCGRLFGLRGQVDDRECDMDGDGEPDCGTGLALDPVTRACEWRNAVYSVHAVLPPPGPAPPGCVDDDATIRAATAGQGDDGGGLDCAGIRAASACSHVASHCGCSCPPPLPGSAPELGFTGDYLGCYIDSEGQFGEAITLGGDTFADDGFGLTFDGDGDYAIITDLAAGNYADSGEFTVAFYFTRVGDCLATPGNENYEALYAHQGSGESSNTLSVGGDRHTRDAIEIYLGCPKVLARPIVLP